MDHHDDVGLAGTLGYAPSYLRGEQYPEAIALFDKFRNQEFAANNPERVFRHVQGGFFILRRSMYNEIGGFSKRVPHDYTDVEYSYYAESMGWKLGQVPQMLALYNKTRPGIPSRVDEHALAMHPPALADLPWLDRIIQKKTRHCNICHWNGAAFVERNAVKLCPKCQSSERERTRGAARRKRKDRRRVLED